jgi:DNA modification methylase
MILKSLQENKEIKKHNSSYDYLNKIQQLDLKLTDYYHNKIKIEPKLNRKLVSFQANKTNAYYRWYKYKEAFSSDLAEYLANQYFQTQKKILDPFAGIGTTLFSCSQLGFDTEGIEILPIGQHIIEANLIARAINNDQDIINRLKHWQINKIWNGEGHTKDFNILPITQAAYTKETEYKIKRYLAELDLEEPNTRKILLFALLCVLESISFTRKDGQYLRWDYRSGRRKGKSTFNKGQILSFDEAITNKLNEIIQDILIGDINKDLFSYLENKPARGKINILKGSCLNILPTLKTESYGGIITSPPYCNRYDYTRTYALEHALLGINNSELASLRQAMLSCTVENKQKDLLSLNNEWSKAIKICDRLTLLQEIINYLEYKKEQKELNNQGIARMVKNYFYEIACVIQECYRVLKKDSFLCMINDNVRYAGASISVDLILSKIAEDIGFSIENILVLSQGKGNSSQQMGKHGRIPLRKCIYIWKKK